MSNPAVFLLAEASIHGDRLRIEDNLGEAIHIHVGAMRFELTTAEFYAFAKSVDCAMHELFQYSGIRLDQVDEESFDWPWAYNYKSITNISLVTVSLKDLYTRAFYWNRPEFGHIVPLGKSPLLQKKIPEFLDQYSRVHDSHVDRNRKMNELLEERGYPFSNKYIMINQLNQIYDGEHRAVALFKKYGGDYELPCLQVSFSNLQSISKQRVIDSKNIVKQVLKNFKNGIYKLRKTNCKGVKRQYISHLANGEILSTKDII